MNELPVLKLKNKIRLCNTGSDKTEGTAGFTVSLYRGVLFSVYGIGVYTSILNFWFLSYIKTRLFQRIVMQNRTRQSPQWLALYLTAHSARERVLISRFDGVVPAAKIHSSLAGRNMCVVGHTSHHVFCRLLP